MRRLALTIPLHLLALAAGAAAGILRDAIVLSLPPATTTTSTPPTPTLLPPHLQAAVLAGPVVAAAAAAPTPQVRFTTNSRILACWATAESLGGKGGLMHATPTAPPALAAALATQRPGSHCTTRLPQAVAPEYDEFTSACWSWVATLSTSLARFASECPEFVGTRPFIRGAWDITVADFCHTTATVFWTADSGPTYLEAVATPTGVGHILGVPTPTSWARTNSSRASVVHTSGAGRVGPRGAGIVLAGVIVTSSIKFLCLL